MITVKDIILLLIGGVAGVLIDTFLGTPLKFLVSGTWFKRKKEKNREKIKNQIYDKLKEQVNKTCDTQHFYAKYKKKVKSIYDMYKLLEEVEYDGRIRKLTYDGVTIETQIWLANK